MRKQLLYLTNAQLTAYMWQGGRLSDGRVFENNPDSWNAFSEYIAENRNVPAYLLTDLIEEDFQRETIPHVTGKARAALIERRLVNLYRDTPYRHSMLQGREKEGRKDDRMLFSALTNAELPKPWLDALLKQKVPLVGIFSIALISHLLFKKLDVGTRPLLLVTHQSSGLRASYFQDGQLRFSRLTLTGAENPDTIAEIADLELAKTRQFLTSARIMARGELTNIIILARSDVLNSMEPLCIDTPELAYRFVDLNQAPHMLGFRHLKDIVVCDQLFLSILANNRLPNQYKVFEQTRFYALWQTRILLYILRVVAIVGGLVWAGMNGLAVLDATMQTRRLDSETYIGLERFQAVTKSMPTTLANPHDMKSAVALEQAISQNAPAPQTILGSISAALEKVPQIQITQLEWQVSETDATIAVAADQAVPPPAISAEAPLSAALIGVPNKPFENVTIEGEVVPFKNNYRTALESVKLLADELGKQPQIHVKITRPPLDVSPTVKLLGQAGNTDDRSKAQFVLTLSRKP